MQPEPSVSAELRRRFGAEIGESCWREFAAKRLTPMTRRRALERHLADHWDDIRASVRRAMIPSERIRDMLQRAGCPVTPADIGLTTGFYATAVRDARFLRDRYTFLDLADDSGRREAVNAALAA